MSKVTTHVLDTANGVPAANMAFRLYRLDAGERTLIKDGHTNADGRCDEPLLADATMQRGQYELDFEAGDYFGGAGDDSYRFLDCVTLRFGIDDETSHYHVPLLVSPFSYSTYRGS